VEGSSASPLISGSVSPGLLRWSPTRRHLLVGLIDQLLLRRCRSIGPIDTAAVSGDEMSRGLGLIDQRTMKSVPKQKDEGGRMRAGGRQRC